VRGSLWRFAAGAPGCSYLRYFAFKQEGTEADLAGTYLCKKGALVLTEAMVLLEGIVGEGRPRC
jgi:hypothetical protein